MPSPRLGRWRQLWFNIHLWIGLTLTILLIPVGVTGSVLVWRQQLSQPPGVTGRTILPLSTYVAAANPAAGEGARVTTIRLPANAGAAVAVVVRKRGGGEGGRAGQATVWLDPATAKVLRVDTQPGGVLRPVRELHENVFAGKIGEVLVGISGFAMSVSALTGLWLWWPRVGGFIGGLAWRRTGWTLLNLHYVGGFWLCIPLAVLSLTGALLAFPVLIGQSPGGPPRGTPGEARMQGGGAPPTPAQIDSVANAVTARHAGARLTSIALPGGGERAWRVQLQPPAGDPINLKVDAASGAESPGPPQGGDPVRRLVHRLHGGEQTGLLWRVWITIAGLAPTLLGITGVLVWLRRRKTRTA